MFLSQNNHIHNRGCNQLFNLILVYIFMILKNILLLPYFLDISIKINLKMYHVYFNVNIKFKQKMINNYVYSVIYFYKHKLQILNPLFIYQSFYQFFMHKSFVINH